MVKRSLNSLADLSAEGLIKEDEKIALRAIEKKYPIALTATIVKLLCSEGPTSPIARQFLPTREELQKHEMEIADPIGDHFKSPVKGIVHRHPDRVLFKVIGICPIYCRFCFRREMIGPQSGENLTEEEINAALHYVKKNSQIWEIILTGGDPFMLSERRIEELLTKIDLIPHVKVVRWHTRVPFVDPQKITFSFIKNLKNTKKTVVVGLHVNHPKEFTEEALNAVSLLREAGISLVSQTVLLRGVNDSVEIMEDLMRRCLEAGILPYYLHHPDLAPGTGHFRVPIARGLDIMRELKRRLSNLASPDYVLDLPGAFGKISLLSSKVRNFEDVYLIEDSEGHVHTYRDAI